MVPAQRLSHATLKTADLDRSIDYFHETTGLGLLERSREGAFLAGRNGRMAIELRKGAAPGLAGISFEIAMEVSDAGEVLRKLGIAGQMRSDPAPGARCALRFIDPCGTEIDLFRADGPVPRASGTAGIGPLKLGHVARVCPEPAKLAGFYERALGFRVSDWIGDFFVFLRCDADHHAVNFFRGGRDQLHHMAFELRDISHMQSACDTLAMARIPIGWGPMRQSAGHNMAVYHRSNDGHVIEYYCELDQMKSEALGYFDPRPWHADRPQRPKVWDPSSWQAGWGTPPAPHFGRTSMGRELEELS